MFNKKIYLPFIMLILALSLAACGTDDGDSMPPEEEKEQTTDEAPVEDKKDEEKSGDDYGNIEVQAEEAFDIYMEKYPTTKVKTVQLEKKMGKYVYNVEGFEGNKEYEVEIDTTDGSITNEDSEKDVDRNNMEITKTNVEKVTEIVDKALAGIEEETTLDEWTIEFDEGITKLEIEIDKKGFDKEEQTYNVETGELLEKDD